MFKKGQLVARAIHFAGYHRASICRVSRVKGGKVLLEGDPESLEYMSSTGAEIAPVVPLFRSFICVLAEEDADKLNKKGWSE